MESAFRSKRSKWLVRLKWLKVMRTVLNVFHLHKFKVVTLSGRTWFHFQLQVQTQLAQVARRQKSGRTDGWRRTASGVNGGQGFCRFWVCFCVLCCSCLRPRGRVVAGTPAAYYHQLHCLSLWHLSWIVSPFLFFFHNHHIPWDSEFVDILQWNLSLKISDYFGILMFQCLPSFLFICLLNKIIIFQLLIFAFGSSISEL